MKSDARTNVQIEQVRGSTRTHLKVCRLIFSDVLIQVIEDQIRANFPSWSDEFHNEARRLRGLYQVGEAKQNSALNTYNYFDKKDLSPTRCVIKEGSWYAPGSFIAPNSQVNRYGGRPEVVARRRDLHSCRSVSLAVDEWVPKIYAGSGAVGFSSGPRSWPAETTTTASTSRRTGASVFGVVGGGGGGAASYARETTVAGAGGGLSDLQWALTGSQAVDATALRRGGQRLLQREAMGAAVSLDGALEERQAHAVAHAAWLESPGTGEHATVKRSALAEDRLAFMGVPVRRRFHGRPCTSSL
jgi:hypothetical protein